jgi:uncharacterized repeat protein (TIGR04076 family)
VSKVIAQVVAVRGTCNAALKVQDVFILDGFYFIPQGHDRTCGVACASLVANVGRLKLKAGPVHISCPDPATGVGGNVLFELSLVETNADD